MLKKIFVNKKFLLNFIKIFNKKYFFHKVFALLKKIFKIFSRNTRLYSKIFHLNEKILRTFELFLENFTTFLNSEGRKNIFLTFQATVLTNFAETSPYFRSFCTPFRVPRSRNTSQPGVFLSPEGSETLLFEKVAIPTESEN